MKGWPFFSCYHCEQSEAIFAAYPGFAMTGLFFLRHSDDFFDGGKTRFYLVPA
jgi:hypothetical protein